MVCEYFELNPSDIQVEPFEPPINSEFFSFELGIMGCGVLSNYDLCNTPVNTLCRFVSVLGLHLDRRICHDMCRETRRQIPIIGPLVKQDLTSLNAFSYDLAHLHSILPVG